MIAAISPGFDCALIDYSLYLCGRSVIVAHIFDRIRSERSRRGATNARDLLEYWRQEHQLLHPFTTLTSGIGALTSASTKQIASLGF